MRRLITMVFLLALALAPASVFAGQIWTDGNGDGLPDCHFNDPYCNVHCPAPQNHLERRDSDLITIDVYLDSQSFQWTNYQAWVQRDGCFQFVSGQYRVTGGTNFPLDNVSNPNATGFAGFGFNQHGVVLVGTLTVHYNGLVKWCLWPIIEIDNPYGTFSVLGTTSSYFLFNTRCGTCVAPPPSSTEPTTWGAIKGIYQ